MNLYLHIENNSLMNISDSELSDDDLIFKNISNNTLDEIIYKLDEESIKYDKKNLINEVSTLLENDIEDDGQDVCYLDEYKIKHWVSNRSFGELIDMYKEDEIIVPQMQRNFVWSSDRSSKLIESILMGLPIPPLFLLEVDDNRYEIIDGYQRINTLFNYINGYPWKYEKNKTYNKKMITSKLSSKVSDDIKNRTFKDLPKPLQQKLKRSTIPLIEFRQFDPDDTESKYLIFERINTGSLHLNPMQIRKSIFHGKYINELYDYLSDIKLNINKIYSKKALNNDNNIEGMLRILCFINIINGKFSPEKKSMKMILNDYCKHNLDASIDIDLCQKIDNIIGKLLEIFDLKTIFRRVEKNNYSGNLNVSIMESLICSLVSNFDDFMNVDIDSIKNDFLCKYELIIGEYYAQEENPFSKSTSKLENIQKRFEVMDELVKDVLRIEG